jgi:hypothetical protein
MMLKTILTASAGLLAGLALTAASTPAAAQTFGFTTVSETDGGGFFGAIPTSSPAIMVGSDGEASFDPFGAGFDVSDGIVLNDSWAPDPAFAKAFGPGFWTQLPGTFTWVLPACNDSGCENADIVEPIAKWDFIGGGGWGPGTTGLLILDANGDFSDRVTVANDGIDGGATITFQSGTNNGAVPEPATWALMISGFGLAGATLRRRARITA